MTIQIPFRGVIEIVGDHDVGKTIAALQVSNNMKDVVFVDDDVKGEGTVRQMQDAGITFDEYIDLAPLRLALGNTPTADELLQQVIFPVVEKIVSKKRKVIVWDTWRIVYQSMRGHVERNQHRYSSVVNFRGNSQIIQGLISKVARSLEVSILNRLRASCDLLVITHHVKDNYVGGVVVGKIPESSATFSEVCNMRIWLRRNKQSKVPIMLFLKRPNMPTMVKGQLRFVNIVPLKITPTEKHESIWDVIEEYQKDPIQSRQPRPEETPTPEELAAISGTLTQEQQSYIKSMIEYQTKMEKELLEAITPPVQSETNVSEGAPVNGVQLLARAKANFNYDLSDIEEILGITFAEINSTYTPKYWEEIENSKKSNAEVKGKKKK